MKNKMIRAQALILTAGLTFSWAGSPVFAEEGSKADAQTGTLVFAQCDDYINIRSTADTAGEVTGKIYNNCAATVVGKEGDWYKITSGNASGYVSAEYFASGEEAERIADEVSYNVATVHPEVLMVRTQPDETSEVLDTAQHAQELEVVDWNGDWMKVALDADTYGYVNAYYVDYNTYYPVAETLEEEQHRLGREGHAAGGKHQAESPQTESAVKEETQNTEPAYTETEVQTPETEPQYTETEPEYVETEPGYIETEPEYIETEPEYVETEPEYVETEPEYIETEPEYIETEPEYIETEPEYVETEPEYVETEPEYVETEPEYVETEPEYVETEPEYIETEPEYVETEPEYVETEPEYVETEPEYVETEPEYVETEPETEYVEQTSDLGQQIADFAVQFVGNPYVYGGTSLTNGTDCSGFTQSVMANFGIGISRTAEEQSYGGTAIDLGSIQPGDLLFYSYGGYIGHVALYIGGGQIVHASTEETGIIISSYDYNYPVSARRYW